MEEKGGDSSVVWYLQLVRMPRAIGHRRKYGWAQETRTIEAGRTARDYQEEQQEGGNEGLQKIGHSMEVKVQYGVFYQRWLTQQAEEAWKAAIPEVDMNEYWEKDLRDAGDVAGWVEHVKLQNAMWGRKWKW